MRFSGSAEPVTKAAIKSLSEVRICTEVGIRKNYYADNHEDAFAYESR